MKKLFSILFIALIPALSFADFHRQLDLYKVHYDVHGLGKDIYINARSSDDARHTVEDMIPDAHVTGAHRVSR